VHSSVYPQALRRKSAYLDPTVVVRFELLRVCALGSWVIGANMQRKLFVALQLEVAHHFVERGAGRRTRRFEAPATFGATKPPKTLLVNPHQFPAHGLLCRCAPSPSDPRACSPAWPARDETSRFAVTTSFAAAYWLIAAENRHPGRGVAEKCVKGRAKFTDGNFGPSVGHPTYPAGLSCELSISERLR
jgi:hypothetical protein